MDNNIRLILSVVASTLLVSCAIENVRPPVDLVGSDDISIPESELLDVSIMAFTPLAEFPETEDINIANLRNAEAMYASWQLAKTMQASNHWGSIRVNPDELSAADIRVSGTVLQSDGQSMRLQIKVQDARGLTWFDRQYLQVLDDSYNLGQENALPPFQSLYTQLANDIRQYAVERFDQNALLTLRHVSQMQFAARFAPDKYQAYLEPDGNGLVTINHLPAANDGIFAQIVSIQDRHDAFLDALQQEYAIFMARIEEPYRNFINLSYRTSEYINDELMKRDEENEGGVPKYANLTDNPAAIYRVKKMSGSRIGDIDFKSNRLNRGRRSQIYSSNLALSGQVFEQEISPLSVQIDKQTYVLTGTVQEQYRQWQEILGEMIRLETGNNE